MYQQHLDLQFPLTQQLGLDLDAPVDQRIEFYVDNNLSQQLMVVGIVEL